MTTTSTVGPAVGSVIVKENTPPKQRVVGGPGTATIPASLYSMLEQQLVKQYREICELITRTHDREREARRLGKEHVARQYSDMANSLHTLKAEIRNVIVEFIIEKYPHLEDFEF